MPFKSGKSITNVSRKIEKFAEETIPKRIRGALYNVATSLGNYADFYVPIDTANLVNSRSHSVSSGKGIYTATVGYYTGYAGILHSPSPGGKMDNWQPKPVPSPGKKTGGFNASATQGWLNIAWTQYGDEIMTNFAEDIIK